MCFLTTVSYMPGRLTDHAYTALLKCALKSMWYLYSKKHSQTTRGAKNSQHQDLWWSDFLPCWFFRLLETEIFPTTSYRFHSCVGALFHIYSPVKEANESPPPLSRQHSHSRSSDWKSTSQQTLLTVCPHLPGLSHIRQSLDSAQLDQETMENFLWKLQRSASKALWTQTPFLKKKQPSIWLYISAVHVLIAAIFFPLSVYKWDLWRPLAGLKSH